jgi:hypothetical protein
MLADFAAWLLSVFVLQPMQSEIAQTLAAAQAPAAVLQEMRTCAGAAASTLPALANESWGWAVGEALQVALGIKSAEAAVAAAVPECSAALQAAAPYLSGEGEGS